MRLSLKRNTKMSLLFRMSQALLVPAPQLAYLIRSAPYRYKTYFIDKRRTGSKRQIAQPAREVKRLQYWVMDNVLKRCPVHSCAMGYREGLGIGDNARLHSANPYLLKLDFRNFFPSIVSDDFTGFMRARGEFDDSELEALSNILFWKPDRNGPLRLSIGAPSSPLLSNVLLNELDEEVRSACAAENAVYSRYADDITISTTDMGLRATLLWKVNSILQSRSSPKLWLHPDKIVFASKAHRRTVTGLVLGNDGNISLGRDRKREIRSKLYHSIQGALTAEDAGKLAGLLAFAKGVEPEFVERLIKKYGWKNVRAAMSFSNR